MRKLFLPLAFLAISFASCNDDDSMVATDPEPIDTTPTPAVELKLFTSSNTSGSISFTDLLSPSPSPKSFAVASTDSDGIFYDPFKDQVIQASRTNNRVEAYSGFRNSIIASATSLNFAFSSTSDFTNAREIAVSGDKVVVTQDQNAGNSNTSKFYVYQRNNDGFSLLNTYTVDIKLWGIHLEGNTMYAIADNTSDLVVYNNFFANATGIITASKRVTIEGLVRTHGITYSNQDNVMVLSDVGLASSATDGGLIIINNFSSVLNATVNMGTIAMNNQIRIYGPNSLLGNPVDVAYDFVTNDIYVAERLNGGGQVLKFSFPTTNGDFAPQTARTEAGVTAVYLLRR